MNRRNFLQAAIAAIAATVTRKWPALAESTPKKLPWWNPDGEVEPVVAWQAKREAKEFGWDDMLNDDLGSLGAVPGRLTIDPILDLQRKMGEAARITLEKELGVHTE